LNKTENIDLYTFEQNGEYYFYILDQNSCRIFHYDTTSTEDDIVAINPFLKNFPNPFNPETSIKFTAEDAEDAEIIIYNIKGQKVRELKIENLKLKINEVVWDGTDNNSKPVSSGIYLYKLNLNGKTEAVKKCLLLK